MSCARFFKAVKDASLANHWTAAKVGGFVSSIGIGLPVSIALEATQVLSDYNLGAKIGINLAIGVGTYLFGAAAFGLPVYIKNKCCVPDSENEPILQAYTP